ncbi:uncharacterized protein LOC144210955 [Stigmatopora nigra]
MHTFRDQGGRNDVTFFFRHGTRKQHKLASYKCLSEEFGLCSSVKEQWEELSSNEESKEQDDSRSFATLPNKVNRGLPVFNKVFTGRAEVLWQHVVKLHALAGHLATFHQKAKVAGVTAIAGLALAPFTFGASLIATAGGIRSASASISDNDMDSLMEWWNTGK